MLVRLGSHPLMLCRSQRILCPVFSRLLRFLASCASRSRSALGISCPFLCMRLAFCENNMRHRQSEIFNTPAAETTMRASQNEYCETCHTRHTVNYITIETDVTFRDRVWDREPRGEQEGRLQHRGRLYLDGTLLQTLISQQP